MYHQHHQRRQYEHSPVYNNNNRSIFRNHNYQPNASYQQYSNGPSYFNEPATPTPRKHYYDSFDDSPHGRLMRSNYYEEQDLYIPNLTSRPTFDDSNHDQVPLPEERTRSVSVVEPPSWCSPAKGESHLEPIGMTREAHKSVDLTKKNYYRIGRSPKSTIPLYHTTASRNHAILYHHPKSNICFIVDNYSVHGTYVDGVRAQPGKETRVRRGAIIRFGSYGCPTFVLKSFSVSVCDLMVNLGCVMDSLLFKKDEKKSIESESTTSEKSNDENDSNHLQQYFKQAQHWVQQPSTSRRNNASKTSKDDDEGKSESSDNLLTCIRGDGGGVACISNEKEIPYASLTLIHTRLNAIGCSTVHDVLYRQSQAEQSEYYTKVNGEIKRQGVVMIDGYDKFVSLSQQYSSSEDYGYSTVKTTKSSLAGKKRKRCGVRPPSPSPQTSAITSSPSKYKSILHSVSMDEDCNTPNVPNYSSQYRPANNGYFYNSAMPRRRTIRFEDEASSDGNQQQQDNGSFYSHPQVSFDNCR